jgi:hypothetical protein
MSGMCIMEIHSGQRQSTMAQAMAHNASTLDRDLDMLITVLVNRHGGVLLDSVRAAQDHIHRAYAGLLDVYGESVAAEVTDPEGHVHDHDHGQERSLVDQAHHDAGLARKFETR